MDLRNSCLPAESLRAQRRPNLQTPESDLFKVIGALTMLAKPRRGDPTHVQLSGVKKMFFGSNHLATCTGHPYGVCWLRGTCVTMGRPPPTGFQTRHLKPS
jgi:hypothetical protein